MPNLAETLFSNAKAVVIRKSLPHSATMCSMRELYVRPTDQILQ